MFGLSLLGFVLGRGRESTLERHARHRMHASCAGDASREQPKAPALEPSHAELKKFASTLDTLRTEEQIRLAQEMHDDLGQLLAATKIELCCLQQCLPTHEPLAQQRLENTRKLVDAMMTSVRRIVANLPPKALEDLGLAGAIETMASDFETRHGVPCHLRFSHVEFTLERSKATAIYRIVQESLNNIAKHADATCVLLEVNADGACIVARVADNGKGMADGAALREGAYGLIGIRQRAAALDGEARIESRIGAGTIISVKIPI